jgi:vancomycin permeability regulator SanA
MLKLLKIIKYILFTGITVCIITALAIIYDGLSDTIQQSDALIILGNKVELTGQPSPRLVSRLEKGFELYQKKMAPLIIVSGGVGIEGFDEAKIMRQYLVDKGIPSDAVLVDSYGVDTFSSAKNIQKIVKEKNLKSVLVVSNYYHISRTVFAFKESNIPEVYSAHANFFEWRDLFSIPREVVGFYFYMLRYTGDYFVPWYENIVLDNVEHHLSCDQLPTREETNKIVQVHRDSIEKIIRESAGPYHKNEDVPIFWDEENMSVYDEDPQKGFYISASWGAAKNCENMNRAELLIAYPGHTERLIIQNIINSSTFFGIPYRLMNT